MAKFLSSHFQYNNKTGVFTTEMSELSAACRPTGLPVFHQVYPDSADEGLTLLSERSGVSVDYVVDGYETNPEDNAILVWILKPTDRAYQVKNAIGTIIRIYNT